MREWSQARNPVAATFYVVSPSGEHVSSLDSASFRERALEIRDRYLGASGVNIPVYKMNLDAFQDASRPLLQYEFSDNRSWQRWLVPHLGW